MFTLSQFRPARALALTAVLALGATPIIASATGYQLNLLAAASADQTTVSKPAAKTKSTAPKVNSKKGAQKPMTQTAPVYQAPAPVYQAPAPAPVYQAPAPVYQAPPPAPMPAPAPAPVVTPVAKGSNWLLPGLLGAAALIGGGILLLDNNDDEATSV